MDQTNRKISRIARTAQRYVNGSLAKLGVGSTEYECLLLIRKNEGTTQSFLQEQLHIDKAAVARMVSNLEKKGLVIRKRDERDRRANNIYSTEKALEVRADKMGAESMFYEWLLEGYSEEELEPFLRVLDLLYEKSREERLKDYVHFKAWLAERNVEKNECPPGGEPLQ